MSQEITVKGIFLESTVNSILANGSQKEIDEMNAVLQNKKISVFHNYPVIIQNKLEAILSRVLFKQETPEGYYKIGQQSFKNFFESNIGKVMLSLFGHEPSKLFPVVKKIYDTVTSGIQIEPKQLAERKYSVHFFNDPYTLKGTEGVLAGAMIALNVKNWKIEAIAHSNTDHEYIITWE